MALLLYGLGLSAFFIIPIVQPSLASTIHEPRTVLAIEICKKTSNYTFCVESLYADPRTPNADRYTLAYITFGLAYVNATATQDYIAQLLKKKAGHEHDRKQRLRRCQRDYNKAVSSLEAAYNDLNSETFFELADLAGDAARSSKDCQAAFNGTHYHPLGSRNRDLKGLCEICVVVSKLFTGT
ncbi:hypothetical protein FNV43_RR08017 [Rhamnella rubrinervis]|uniref:Pectinesterase inhibitor domain-containing protein n=1 Tax=Rhamnella rubrinervis TaxID=2594499 RepID=A0A8K0HFS3_9ROSA|nr:hypothetical protein FNV43_RR08017 [Rhamnella rubrinervis]